MYFTFEFSFLVKHPPAGMAENPWADTAPATRGFDPNICKSLLKELEECIDLFSKLYQDIGTRNDTRELRGKLSSLRNKANDAAARLRSQLAEPISQRYVNKLIGLHLPVISVSSAN